MFLESLLKVAQFNPDRLSFPDSWIGHTPFAAWLVQTIRPSVFVELGTHTGNSYLAFCQAICEANLQTKCYAVDTWQGDDHAGNYDESVYQNLYSYHQKKYGNFSRLLRMTFDDACQHFSNGSIDLLHVDGLHTYEAVKHDFENWLPKLAPHAVVLFHDTNVRERDFGVWNYWEEISVHYHLHLEFIHSNGLGVLQLSKSKETHKFGWLEPDFAHHQLLLDFFASLGQRIVEQYNNQELRQFVKAQEEDIQGLLSQVTEKNKIMQTLRGELRDIKSSKAWKVAMALRGIRIFLLPPSHWRTHMFQRIISFFRSPFNFQRNNKISQEVAYIRNSTLFQQDWYLARNPDVAQSGIDPARHYLLAGGFEGRDPGPEFSSTWYLEMYLDGQLTEINPLLHYLKNGKAQGFLTKPLDAEVKSAFRGR